MKKFLTTAFLFTLAAVAFAQGAPVAAQKSLFEGQFVAHLSSPSPPPAAVWARARPWSPPARASPAIPRPPVPSARP